MNAELGVLEAESASLPELFRLDTRVVGRRALARLLVELVELVGRARGRVGRGGSTRPRWWWRR